MINNLFELIPDASAVLYTRGLYREAQVYKHENKLFAGVRGGYVCLLPRNYTSTKLISWREINGVDFRESYNGLNPVVKPVRVKAVK